MSETMIDERGRVLIPEEIRESAGLTGGTVVTVEAKDGRIVIKTLRRERKGWKKLCGVSPQRTGKQEWPTPRELKSIWE